MEGHPGCVTLQPSRPSLGLGFLTLHEAGSQEAEGPSCLQHRKAVGFQSQWCSREPPVVPSPESVLAL